MRVAIGTSSFGATDRKPLDKLERAGVEIAPNPFGRRMTEDEIIALLSGVDGLLAGLEPLTRKVFEAAPRLRAVARVGIGLSNVDLNAAREFGIAVSITPDAPTEAVAEATVAAGVVLSRGFVNASAAMHEGRWVKQIGFGLRETACLVIGYGRIGRRVADIMCSMGADVMVTDPAISEKDVPPGLRLVPLVDGLRNAKIVTIHASSSDTLLGTREFQVMQDGVILLNSARAELVAEEAMLRALEAGKVAGAWFDVFWEEPYRGALTKFPQILLTPHMGTYTEQCRVKMETSAVENLLRDLGEGGVRPRAG